MLSGPGPGRRVSPLALATIRRGGALRRRSRGALVGGAARPGGGGGGGGPTSTGTPRRSALSGRQIESARAQSADSAPGRGARAESADTMDTMRAAPTSVRAHGHGPAPSRGPGGRLRWPDDAWASPLSCCASPRKQEHKVWSLDFFGHATAEFLLGGEYSRRRRSGECAASLRSHNAKFW